MESSKTVKVVTSYESLKGGRILAQDTLPWLPRPHTMSAFELLDTQYDDCKGCCGSRGASAASAALCWVRNGPFRVPWQLEQAPRRKPSSLPLRLLWPSLWQHAMSPPDHRKAIATKPLWLCSLLAVSPMSSEAHRSCRQRTTPPDPASFPFRSFLLPLSRALDIYIYGADIILTPAC